MKFLLVTLLFTLSVFAQDSMTIVAIGEAKLKKMKVAISAPEIKGSPDSKLSNTITEIYELFKNDFSFYRHKLLMYEFDKGANGDPFSSETYEKWKLKDYSYVIATRAFANKNGTLEYGIRLYNVETTSLILEKTFNISLKDERNSGHEIADEIYQKIFNKESVFKTEIAFVSDRPTVNRRKSQIKELYLMDFDGREVKRLTWHKGVVISPAISPDKKKIIYSLVQDYSKKKKRNVNLYIMDVPARKSTVLSNKLGINSGAAFTAEGDDILLTLSHTGNADIYRMNLETKKTRRLTSHYADDVDPSLNAAGTMMSFLSGRSGPAHIYTADPSGTEKSVRRISYVGRFNATPRFSPEGKEIVFSSWVDNRFDIYRIGSDGNNLVRLTKNFGSNEEPMFSKDGEFIIFTSQRILSAKEAIQNVYIMNREGEVLGQLTKNFGNCSSPRWSN